LRILLKIYLSLFIFVFIVAHSINLIRKINVAF